MSEWLESELSESRLSDKRLTKRYRSLWEQLWNGIGNTIPFACQDWANTKAAYRFLSNDGVTEDLLLAGHFESTRKRVDAIPDEMILVLQDTTAFSFHRADTEAVGFTRIIFCNKDILGQTWQISRKKIRSSSWIHRYLARVFKTCRYPSWISAGEKYL